MRRDRCSAWRPCPGQRRAIIHNPIECYSASLRRWSASWSFYKPCSLKREIENDLCRLHLHGSRRPLRLHDRDQLVQRETVIDPVAATLASTFRVAARAFLELSSLGRPAVANAVSYSRPSLFSAHLIDSDLQGIFPINGFYLETDEGFSCDSGRRIPWRNGSWLMGWKCSRRSGWASDCSPPAAPPYAALGGSGPPACRASMASLAARRSL